MGWESNHQPNPHSAKVVRVVGTSQRDLKPISKTRTKLNINRPMAVRRKGDHDLMVVAAVGAGWRVHWRIKSPAMVPGIMMKRYCRKYSL